MPTAAKPNVHLFTFILFLSCVLFCFVAMRRLTSKSGLRAHKNDARSRKIKGSPRTGNSFCPHAAADTNIGEDGLDRGVQAVSVPDCKGSLDDCESGFNSNSKAAVARVIAALPQGDQNTSKQAMHPQDCGVSTANE